MALGPRTRVLLLAASILLGLTALVWYLSSRPRPTPATPIPAPPATTGELTPPPNDTGNVAAPPQQTTESAPPTPNASPSAEASASATGKPSPAAADNAPRTSPPPPPPASGEEARAPGSAATNLLIPVAGVGPEQLQDTFTQSRSEGRTHNAIDIMAARHTPVIAAADGRVVRLFQSERGGITLYQLGTDERTVYYYAHLERYADGIAENRFLRRGELLGYVGDSGNAGKDNCHLHFSVWLITDPKRFWDGENVNPYSLLTKR